MKTLNTFVILIPYLILGCSNYDFKNDNNNNVSCFDMNQDDYNIEPVPLLTGLEREQPIELITKDKFIERLKSTYLWSNINSPNEESNDFSIESINGLLQLQGGGVVGNSEGVIKISYTSLNAEQRNQFGHHILKEEKQAMLEIINILIGDRKKSENIINSLNKKYMLKIKNNEVLSDGETIHTYVKYDDKYYEFWGIIRQDHPIKECNFNMFSGLSIS